MRQGRQAGVLRQGLPEEGEAYFSYLTDLPIKLRFSQDWRRHKPFCREGAPVDELAASMRQVVYEDIGLINFADIDSYQRTFDIFKESFQADGTVDPQPESARKECMLDVPDVHGGKNSKWVSSTIDPAALKQLRKFAEEAIARRRS